MDVVPCKSGGTGWEDCTWRETPSWSTMCIRVVNQSRASHTAIYEYARAVLRQTAERAHAGYVWTAAPRASRSDPSRKRYQFTLQCMSCFPEGKDAFPDVCYCPCKLRVRRARTGELQHVTTNVANVNLLNYMVLETAGTHLMQPASLTKCLRTAASTTPFVSNLRAVPFQHASRPLMQYPRRLRRGNAASLVSE